MKSDQLGRVLSDDDTPTKISIANEFKAFVKKNSVPRELIHPYFLTLSQAIRSREDPQLTSVCFSCFCHLFKRVSIQDKQLLDNQETVAVVTDLLIDRLSDRSNGVRATANKVLLDYWVLVPQAVAVAMRQNAVVSSNHVTLGESVKWLQSVFDLSSAFNFSAFVQPVVDMLRYPQLQAPVTELLQKVYSVADRRELEGCLAVSGVSEMVKRGVLGGDDAKTVQKPLPQRTVLQKAQPKEQQPTQSSDESNKENTPTSSLTFLDNLANFKIDSIPPENVYSASDLESKFQNMHAAFHDKESEKNWSQREKHVTQIRKLLRGNALNDYPTHFSAAYKSVIDGVLKSATSLRTTLSNQGLMLIKESGQLGGSSFVDPVTDLVFPQIIRLTGQMKKITSNNAHITVCGLLTSASYSTKLVSHVTSATTDKNAQPRTFAAVWLRIIVLLHSQNHKTSLQNHGGLEQIEKAIAKGLVDPTPSVKENMRVTYWSFADFWPAEAEKIYSKLDPKARGMLDKVNPKGGNSRVDGQNRPRVPSVGNRPSNNGSRDPSAASRDFSAPSRTSRDFSAQSRHARSLSRSSSGIPSRESSLAPSVKSRDSSPPRDSTPPRDDVDMDDPFVTQQLKLSQAELRAEAVKAEEKEDVEMGESRDSESRDPESSEPRDIEMGESRAKTPESSPFVLAKSPATQGFSTSPATGKSASPPGSAEDELSRDLESSHVTDSNHVTESNHVIESNHVTNPVPGNETAEPDELVHDAPAQDSQQRRADSANGESCEESEARDQVESRDLVESEPQSERQSQPAPGQLQPAAVIESRDAVESRDDTEARDEDESKSHDLSRDIPTPPAVDTANVPVLSPRPVKPARIELDADAMDESRDGVESRDDSEPRDEPVEVESRDSEPTESRDPEPALPEAESKAEPEAPQSEEPATSPSASRDVEMESEQPRDDSRDVEMAHVESRDDAETVTEAVQEDPFGVQHSENGGERPEPESRDQLETESRDKTDEADSRDASKEDESEPMEMCDSDNDQVESKVEQTKEEPSHVPQPDHVTEPTTASHVVDFSSRDLKAELNTSSPEDLSSLLSDPSTYSSILDTVPAELFLLCVILFAERHVTAAQHVISRDTNLALSTASSMVMVCARDVYPTDSRWSGASVDELKHVTVTCLEWLTQLVSENADAKTLLSTNKRYRTSLVHLLSTSVELHKQKFGHVTHNALIHVIEAMDRLSQQKLDKRTSRAFLEAPSPSPDSSLVDVTDQLSHVTVKDKPKTVRVRPVTLRSGHVISDESQVTWSQLELERLARSTTCADSTEAILDCVSRDKASATQLSTLASRVPSLDESAIDHVTATVLAYLHTSHPPALTGTALLVIKQVLTKQGLSLSMGHVTEIYATLSHVSAQIDSRSPLAAAIEELVADLLAHADSAEFLEFLLSHRSRDRSQHKLLLLNTVYHVIDKELLVSHESGLLGLISELISDSDPLVRRVTVGLVVRVLRLSPEMEGAVSGAIKSKMDLVRYYMGS
ncbi:Protein STU1 [Yarrowia sp. B02]|nr:Protein STU1 [Yarrowia sp. B02]